MKFLLSHSAIGRIGRFIGATMAPLLVGLSATAQTPPAPKPTQPCLVIVGDSTVCDYPDSHTNRGWGQYLHEHFTSGLRVMNLANATRSTKTFIELGHWKKALDERPNYILIQFGHSDSHALHLPESTDFATDYKANLRRMIDESRAIGATPILVTPMVRRTFDPQGRIAEAQSPPNRPLESYVNAMKEVAGEKKVAVIDLFASSKVLAEKLGPQATAELAAKAGDVAHFNEKGARLTGELVLKELLTAEPKLRPYLRI